MSGFVQPRGLVQSSAEAKALAEKVLASGKIGGAIVYGDKAQQRAYEAGRASRDDEVAVLRDLLAAAEREAR
jgi:hypothetical protein